MHDLKLVWRFAFHTIGAATLFALVGAAAALLHYYTEALATLHMPVAVLTAIRWTEYLLFAVDLMCFILYVLRETWTLIHAMFVPETAARSDVATD